jgi:hypothetical protein
VCVVYIDLHVFLYVRNVICDAEQEGPVLFTSILGGAMALGSDKTVENVNNSLVAVVLIRYVFNAMLFITHCLVQCYSVQGSHKQASCGLYAHSRDCNTVNKYTA